MADISIYTRNINSRIEYAMKIVFPTVLGVNYRLISNREEFNTMDGARLNYSDEDIAAVVQIIPHGLLNDTDIKLFDIRVSEWHDIPVFFQTNSSDIPFDLFSAVFFLVARYEEYLPFIPDQHGRFSADQSLAWREKFLRIPVVDLWCIELAKQLNIVQNCNNIRADNYRFLLTIDIDVPWAYRHKGFFRTAGALLKDFITLRFNTFSSRFKILSNKMTDPGDSYTFLEEVQKSIEYPIHYFALCRHKRPYDTNSSVGKRVFSELLQQIDNRGNVGIHPSYISAGYAPFLVEEVKYLSDILQRMVETSRQHFLRLSFPDTYRNLINLGITTDFTLGYSDQTGFRAGIARSFNFYDLWAEKETNLKIVPFQVMDRTLLGYLNYTPGQAMEEFAHYSRFIKSVGGEHVCLWHNDSLTDWGEWKGWKQVFESMIEQNKTA